MPNTCFCVFSACVIVNFLGYQHHIKTHWNNQKQKLNFDLKLCFGGIWIVEQKVLQTSAISPLLTPPPTHPPTLKLGLKKYILSFPSGMNKFLNTQLLFGPLTKILIEMAFKKFCCVHFIFSWFLFYLERINTTACCCWILLIIFNE